MLKGPLCKKKNPTAQKKLIKDESNQQSWILAKWVKDFHQRRISCSKYCNRVWRILTTLEFRNTYIPPMPVVDRDSCHFEVATFLDCFPRCPVVPKSLVKYELKTSWGLKWKENTENLHQAWRTQLDLPESEQRCQFPTQSKIYVWKFILFFSHFLS